MEIERCKRHDEDIKKLYSMAIPVWVRTLIVGSIIALYSQFLVSGDKYATKADMQQLNAKIDGLVTVLLERQK